MNTDNVKTGLAVVGAFAVASSLIVVVKRALERRRNDRLRQKVAVLQAELAEATAVIEKTKKPKPQDGDKPIRIYMDGCFDMMHFGHSNALRQARAVGTQLVVGLIGDEEIIANKGAPPVMPFHERLEALKACKFVDEVIEKPPYDVTPEWTRTLVSKYKIDFIVHGDDPCINEFGEDCYATAKKMGVFKTVKRTEGVSTTDLVGRMLLMTSAHHIRPLSKAEDETKAANDTGRFVRERAMSEDLAVPDAAISQFLPTSHRIIQFSKGVAPKKGDRVVYVAGSWDLFNAGHARFLKEAKEQGDFLLVGIWDDDTVSSLHVKHGYPIMNIHERTLSVLSCRYVDEVIIGAPRIMTNDMITTMHISKVVDGQLSDDVALGDNEAEIKTDLPDPWVVARERGILAEIPAANKLTAKVILDRVLANRATFQAKFDKKHKSETQYYAQKNAADFVEET